MPFFVGREVKADQKAIGIARLHVLLLWAEPLGPQAGINAVAGHGQGIRRSGMAGSFSDSFGSWTWPSLARSYQLIRLPV